MNHKDTKLPPGLYLVGTPLGRARDITLHALDVLASADVLVAEDTRTLRKLLEIHGVPLKNRRIIAYHDHSGAKEREFVLDFVRNAHSVAYASEAGMPLIADPGYQLVATARKEGLLATSAPGATAATTALAISGLPSDKFLFHGFLPAAKIARKEALTQYHDLPATLVFYESPGRLTDCLVDMQDVFGTDRQAAVCRELTKKFEEVIKGSLGDILANVSARTIKGEIVILVAPPTTSQTDPKEVETALINALETMRVKDAADNVAGAFNLPRRDIYQLALTLKEKTKT